MLNHFKTKSMHLKKAIGLIGVLLILLLQATHLSAQVENFGNLGDFEIYSMGDQSKAPPKVEVESRFKLTPKNALNGDGLGGFFVSETADKLLPDQLIFATRYKYHKITANRGTALHSTEDGSVSTFEGTLNWVGKWAEWAVTIPIHDWNLNAPKTFGGYPSDNTGLGNMRLGWKATYLPDKSYYRFAYGAVMTVTTGNPDRMLPAGSKKSDEMKLFGCVTTKETDRATANLELGGVIDSESEDDRFLYRFALSYEATEHASLIGEFAGEVLGGDDKDTMDLIVGIRLAPTRNFTLEIAYYKNLRTYREYGWDDQLQLGTTIKW